MFTWIKNFIIKWARKKFVKKVVNFMFGKIEKKISCLISESINAKELSYFVIEYIKRQMKSIAKKAYGKLKKIFSKGDLEKLMKDIDKLDIYKDDLESIILKYCDGDDLAKIITNYIKNMISELIKKII